MRIHIYKTCENPECASKANGELEGINLYGDTLHHVELDEDKRKYTECSICGEVKGYRDPDAYNTRYPYYSGSAGVEFQSKEHERSYVRKHKLVGV